VDTHVRNARSRAIAAATRSVAPTKPTAPAPSRPPGQIVLVFQGGGALGAYQAGVYQAMHEAGIEPDWVIGTSIGAINGAIIVGNEPHRRLEPLERFWKLLEWRSRFAWTELTSSLIGPWANLAILTQGVAGFFAPNLSSWWSLQTPLGIERAAFYTTTPLRQTLDRLINFDLLNRGTPRLTVGAVSARSGEMRYFDSRRDKLCAEHVMASGALPPWFPAVRIDGEPYWDGGIYSNTPIEAVLDDNPRRSSTVFSVHLWNPGGSEPDSIWEVLGRKKEIQYASRAASHIGRQKQIHRLRHVIARLVDRIPKPERDSSEVRELAAWGCRTMIHIVQLLAPRLANEDHTKDIDFTRNGIHSRWEAGYADTRDAIAQAPWICEVDPIEGVLVHEHKSKEFAMA
jgi:NTE family protein